MKIVVIGGASYIWAFGFLQQFILNNTLPGVEIDLVDKDPVALDHVARAAGMYNISHGSPIVLKKEDDLDRALDGADFVMVSISTGGFEAMQHDLGIPEKYGIYHTVGDTVGPGGWLRAVRNIPVFNDFGERMSRLCPDAWMINVTNPLTPLTRVAQRNFGIKTIGMCPGVDEGARAYSTLASASPDSRMDYTVTGIDHGSFFTSLYADGIDVLQRLKEMGYYRSDDKIPATLKADDPLADMSWFRANFAIWREIGYLPSVADRHSTENWPWFIPNDSPELDFEIPRTNVADRVRWRNQKKQQLEEYIETQDEKALGHQGHGEDPMRTVIEGLLGHNMFVYTGNYMNVGQIPDLPLGSVVETRCLYDRAGVHPFCSTMPDVIKTVIYPHVLRQEMIIDIALDGTLDDLVALVQTDPLCSRLKMGQAREMVKEMLLANRPLIRNQRLFE
jgi:alpha-galactosidase